MKLLNDEIINDLNKSLGIRFLEDDKKSEVLTRVLELVSKRAGLRIIEKFNAEEMAEFNEISKDDFERMENFIIAKNPAAQDIFNDEAGKVREELLDAKV